YVLYNGLLLPPPMPSLPWAASYPLSSLSDPGKRFESPGHLLEELGARALELVAGPGELDLSRDRHADYVLGAPGHGDRQLGGFALDPVGFGFQEDRVVQRGDRAQPGVLGEQARGSEDVAPGRLDQVVPQRE